MSPKKAELTAEIHVRVTPALKSKLEAAVATYSKEIGIKISLSQYITRILEQSKGL